MSGAQRARPRSKICWFIVLGKTGVHLRHIRRFTGCVAEHLLVTVNHQQLGSPWIPSQFLESNGNKKRLWCNSGKFWAHHSGSSMVSSAGTTEAGKKQKKHWMKPEKNLITRRWHVSLTGLDVKFLTGKLKECLRVASYKKDSSLNSAKSNPIRRSLQKNFPTSNGLHFSIFINPMQPNLWEWRHGKTLFWISRVTFPNLPLAQGYASPSKKLVLPQIENNSTVGVVYVYVWLHMYRVPVFYFISYGARINQ